jgi:hypothetical protein
LGPAFHGLPLVTESLNADCKKSESTPPKKTMPKDFEKIEDPKELNSTTRL